MIFFINTLNYENEPILEYETNMSPHFEMCQDSIITLIIGTPNNSTIFISTCPHCPINRQDYICSRVCCARMCLRSTSQLVIYHWYYLYAFLPKISQTSTQKAWLIAPVATRDNASALQTARHGFHHHLLFLKTFLSETCVIYRRRSGCSADKQTSCVGVPSSIPLYASTKNSAQTIQRY